MKVTIKQWAASQRTLKGRFHAAASRALNLAGQRAVFEMQRQTEQKKVFDTGGYKGAWRFSTPEQYVLRIYNQKPYSSVIEYGRRAGATMPPPSALKSWVRHKLGVRDEATARSVAFLVAAKIQRDGIPGKFVLRDARPTLVKIIREEVERELARSLSGGA